MLTAIRQKVTVGAGGRIELPSSELPEGEKAEVIVLLENSAAELPSLTSLIGQANSFESAEEIDAFLREGREP